MPEFRIREMQVTDIAQVCMIEKEIFPTPWPADVFQQEIKGNDFAYYFVLETNGNVVGYVGTWIVFDDAQITNIAILPKYRGLKLGERLFGYALEQAVLLGGKRLSLEVRVTNVVAQNLYRKFGLEPGGIRKNYYTDNQEDAIVMWVNLYE